MPETHEACTRKKYVPKLLKMFKFLLGHINVDYTARGAIEGSVIMTSMTVPKKNKAYVKRFNSSAAQLTPNQDDKNMERTTLDQNWKDNSSKLPVN